MNMNLLFGNYKHCLIIDHLPKIEGGQSCTGQQLEVAKNIKHMCTGTHSVMQEKYNVDKLV